MQMAANTLSRPIKWRLSFKSRLGRLVVQLAELNPSAPFEESIQALKAIHSDNTRSWKTRFLPLLYDVVILDGTISDVSSSRPNLADQSRIIELISFKG